MKTAGEIYAATGISRKTFRLYTGIGLIRQVCKSDHGYWLYPDDTAERIQLIKNYQNMGFTLREINVIFNDPQLDMEAALISKVGELEQNVAELKRKISAAEKALEEIRSEKEAES